MFAKCNPISCRGGRLLHYKATQGAFDENVALFRKETGRWPSRIEKVVICKLSIEEVNRRMKAIHEDVVKILHRAKENG